MPAERAGARQVGGHEDQERGQRGEGDEPPLEGDAGQAAHEPGEQQHRDRGADDAPELGEVGAGAEHQRDDGDGGQDPAEARWSRARARAGRWPGRGRAG